MESRAKRKVQTGIVVSNKMDKTIVVEVERRQPHPFYQKVLRSSTKFKAHDEKNECRIGDLVEVMETRPLSREKRWRLVRVIGQAALSRHELPKMTDKAIERKKEKNIDPAAE